MDQLLEQVKQEAIPASEVPLSSLTDQFLQYLLATPNYPLYFSGEAVWLFGMLLELKSIYLLPQVLPEEEEDQQAIEAALLNHIEAYRTFKEVAFTLAERKRAFQQAYPRPASGEDPIAPPLQFQPVSVNQLLEAFQQVLSDFEKRDQEIEVRGREISILDRMKEMDRYLTGKVEGVSFETLFSSGETRQEIVVTFLAVLELIRRGRILLLQERLFGQIMIFGKRGKRDGTN